MLGSSIVALEPIFIIFGATLGGDCLRRPACRTLAVHCSDGSKSGEALVALIEKVITVSGRVRPERLVAECYSKGGDR